MGYEPNHKRMKPKAGAEPTAKERAHMDRVAKLPCLVSGEYGVTLHHVTASSHVMGRFPRSHQLVVPLARRYHQRVADPSAREPISVEGLGHRGFYKKYGIDLLAEAEFLRAESIMEGIL
jgi:hypothetical protein